MGTIRQVTGDERLHTAFTLYPYAFDATPSASAAEELRGVLRYHEDNHTLIVEEDGRTLATAGAIPMRQNLRGTEMAMAAIAWVATRPDARRQGHSRRLMHQMHRDMLGKGNRLAVLYPFHPSFYEKFGYIGLPLNRTVSLTAEGLAPLLEVRLPGEVTWQNIREGFEGYRAFQRNLVSQRHGYMYTPDFRAARAFESADRWLVTASVDGEVVGMLTYQIDGYGGTMRTDELLYTSPLGRALLLQFLAQHAYQVGQIEMMVAPDETPETWVTGLTVRSVAEAAFPSSPPMMARLLTMDALRDLPCGAGRVEIEIVDDQLLAGRYLLDGTGGTLDVSEATGTGTKATLTAAGLAGLAYGVLDPLDLVARGLGDVPESAVAELGALLPRCTPHAFGKG